MNSRYEWVCMYKSLYVTYNEGNEGSWSKIVTILLFSQVLYILLFCRPNICRISAPALTEIWGCNPGTNPPTSRYLPVPKRRLACAFQIKSDPGRGGGGDKMKSDPFLEIFRCSNGSFHHKNLLAFESCWFVNACCFRSFWGSLTE